MLTPICPASARPGRGYQRAQSTPPSPRMKMSITRISLTVCCSRKHHAGHLAQTRSCFDRRAVATCIKPGYRATLHPILVNFRLGERVQEAVFMSYVGSRREYEQSHPGKGGFSQVCIYKAPLCHSHNTVMNRYSRHLHTTARVRYRKYLFKLNTGGFLSPLSTKLSCNETIAAQESVIHKGLC